MRDGEGRQEGYYEKGPQLEVQLFWDTGEKQNQCIWNVDVRQMGFLLVQHEDESQGLALLNEFHFILSTKPLF